MSLDLYVSTVDTPTKGPFNKLPSSFRLSTSDGTSLIAKIQKLGGSMARNIKMKMVGSSALMATLPMRMMCLLV